MKFPNMNIFFLSFTHPSPAYFFPSLISEVGNGTGVEFKLFFWFLAEFRLGKKDRQALSFYKWESWGQSIEGYFQKTSELLKAKAGSKAPIPPFLTQVCDPHNFSSLH